MKLVLLLALMVALGGVFLALLFGVMSAVSEWGLVAAPLVLVLPPALIVLVFAFVIAEKKSGL